MNKRITILKLDQVAGPNALEVFQKYGVEAGVTGYAIKRGTEPFKLKGKFFAAQGIEPGGDLLDQMCCEYWTSTKAEGTIGKAYSIGGFEAKAEPTWESENGIRLVVPLEDIQDEIMSSYTIEGLNGEVKVVTYGEYPQSTFSVDESVKLTGLYENGVLKPTGKSYGAEGFDTERYYDGDKWHYEQDDYPEYEYNGEKYVLAKRAVYDNGDSRYFWSKVEPIEWLVDEKSGLAISRKCIVGGIPLKRNGVYLGNIDKTRVQKFIDNELSYDIQVKDKKLTKDIDNMMEEDILEEEKEKSL